MDWSVRRQSVRRKTIRFDNLPGNFHGYKIGFLSDLHVTNGADFIDFLTGLLRDLDCDIVLLGGDYAGDDFDDGALAGKLIADAFKSSAFVDGIVAVRGNHDNADLSEIFDKSLDIRLAHNRTLVLERGSDRIFISGTDDPHLSWSDECRDALVDLVPALEFGIALMHSPERADVAAAKGYSLQLSGHTHGGQIALPGGVAIITQMKRLRRLARGYWRITRPLYRYKGRSTEGRPKIINSGFISKEDYTKNSYGASGPQVGKRRARKVKRHRLYGYTSAGFGYSTMPLRLFARPEIIVLTLERTGGGNRGADPKIQN